MRQKTPIALSLMLLTGLIASPSLNANASTMANINPYRTVAATNASNLNGVFLADAADGSRYITEFEKGDSFSVDSLNIYQGIDTINVNVKSFGASLINVYENDANGKYLGAIKVNDTRGEYKTFSSKISSISGEDTTLYFSCELGDMDIDSWYLTAPEDYKIVRENTDLSRSPRPLNPYRPLLANYHCDGCGIEEVKEGDKTVVSSLEPTDYYQVYDIDFREGLTKLNIIAKSEGEGELEVRLGGPAGEKLGTINLTDTNGEYVLFSGEMDSISDVHSITFVGKKGNISISGWVASTDRITYEEPVVTPNPVNIPDHLPDEKPVSTSDNKDLTYTINNWGDGYTVSFKLTNNTDKDMTDYSIKIKKDQLNISSNWCINVAEEGDYYVLTPMSWNSTLSKGQFIEFGISGNGSIGSTFDYTVE